MQGNGLTCSSAPPDAKCSPDLEKAMEVAGPCETKQAKFHYNNTRKNEIELLEVHKWYARYSADDNVGPSLFAHLSF